MRVFTLENGNRRYEIAFHRYNIVQICGLSATGKSLFFSDFVEQQLTTDKYNNCLLINFRTADRLEKLWTDHVYDMVVIDDADALITPELDEHIRNRVHTDPTLWIILGRPAFSCVPAFSCRTPLTCYQEGETPNERFLFTTTYNNVAFVS